MGRMPKLFVTAQGSPYTRLRRALDRGSVTEALSSAAELEHVGLTEALELCLLLVDKSPERFGRAALRWHGRYCREWRDVDLDEGFAVLGLLAAWAEFGSGPPALADMEQPHYFLAPTMRCLRRADAYVEAFYTPDEIVSATGKVHPFLVGAPEGALGVNVLPSLAFHDVTLGFESSVREADRTACTNKRRVAP